MRLHEELWEDNRPLAHACLGHPFVTALRDGTLEADVFRAYIAQDAFFLQAFGRAYALALAKTSGGEALATFSQLIGGVEEELKLHASYAAQLKIDLEGTAPSRATQVYTDFLMATCWQGSLGEILAAMTPCMRLYLYLAREISEQLEQQPVAKEPHPYGRWIATYTSGEFQILVKQLEDLLNRYARDTPPVRVAYRYAMECEFRFFEQVLRDTGRPTEDLQ